MAVLETIEEWQHQSALLLQARPTTARITTKYNIPNLESTRYQKQKKRKREPEDKEASSAPKVSRAVVTLKTYDPESGVCLRFKTDKAADVGRLVGGLGRLGRNMAALPPKTEDSVMADAPPAAEKATLESSTGPGPISTNADPPVQPGAGGGGGGGKKKKKGKK